MRPLLPDPVLSVANLRVSFGQTEALRGMSLAVARGETHCMVGESRSGNSVSALSVMNLLPRGINRTADHIRFQGQDLLGMSERQMARLRGDKIALIFQEPMTSLNPAYTIGSQMSEGVERHRRGTRRQPRAGQAPWPISPSAFRRAAPAGDDRHGADVRSGAVDRRRTHDGPRCDGSGADPAAITEAAAGVGPGTAVDHA